jgi:hypothetical protein
MTKREHIDRHNENCRCGGCGLDKDQPIDGSLRRAIDGQERAASGGAWRRAPVF